MRLFSRIAQCNAYLSKEAPQINATLSYVSGKGSTIPLPSENRRVMKDVLRLNY
jgi:hypothetical protein